MGCTFRMHVNLRPLLCPPSGSTRVIEMNMRDEHMRNLPWLHTMCSQPSKQRRIAGTWAGLNQRIDTRTLDEVGGDNAGPALKQKINGDDLHEEPFFETENRGYRITSNRFRRMSLSDAPASFDLVSAIQLSSFSFFDGRLFW